MPLNEYFSFTVAKALKRKVLNSTGLIRKLTLTAEYLKRNIRFILSQNYQFILITEV